MPAPLLAVDAPALLYRAFFALPDSIRGADGKPVNALLGTLNYMLRAVAERAPRAVVLCVGQESGAYRVEAYPDYHAARPPMPDDLRRQFDRLPELAEAFGWATSTHDSLEADDLLASHAADEADAGGEALILTGDRDLFQCASERVRVLWVRTGKDVSELGPEEVRRHYGVGPELVPDFIALRGDPSDGLPGARGIGPKKAADLLRRHGSLEATIAAALRESPGVRAALRADPELLVVFKDIATLRRVSVPRAPDRATDPVAGAVAARELGMGRLAQRLEGDG